MNVVDHQQLDRSHDRCWSHMGKVVNNGAQDLSLQIPGCVHHSVALHELLHALGFAHEQTRPDRDTYVRVYYENIQAGLIDVIFSLFYAYQQLFVFRTSS